MHKIHFRPGLCPDLAVGAYDAPQTSSRMVRGHPSPRFLPLRSRRLQIEVVIGPRDNGFPDPTVALDGPGGHEIKTLEIYKNT